MNEATAITLTVTACSAALVLGVIAISGPTKKLWKKAAPLIGRLRMEKVAPADEWDHPSIVYRVLSSTIGFLALEHVVLWLTIFPAAHGFRGLNIEGLFCVWLGVIAGFESIPGIIGVVGIVCATVYGVHQDLPEHRFKTLFALGVCGILIGLGLRLNR